MMFESKLPNRSTSIFTKMSKMAIDYNAINLSQGFPNFKSDPILIEAVNKAMVDGFNQYAPMAGDRLLREVISLKILELYGKEYDPEDEITITAGATQAIFTAISAVINKGDEVIIFTPAYDCYEPTITLFGGITIPIQLEPPFYQPDWDEVETRISKKTRMIIVNTPHNPSGMLFSKEDLKRLEQLCEQHDLLVLSDEVYEHIIFDGLSHESAAGYSSLSSRAFITASFGKTFHNTGWKMGYCLAPKELTKEFRKVHQFNVFCVNHPIQKALSGYLQNKQNYIQLGNFYQQKRDLFLSLMQGSNFKIEPSKGTYFQLLDFSEISNEGDIEFAERLTRDLKVATIPTSVFNLDQLDFKQIRVCFAKTEDTLIKAASILKEL